MTYLFTYKQCKGMSALTLLLTGYLSSLYATVITA